MERRGLVGTALAALAGIVTGSGEAVAGQAATTPMPIQIGRRVVTGVDEQGRSRIESEAPVPPSATWNEDDARGMDFWVVRQVPARLDGAL